jgi:hypothetical protein
MLASLNLLGMHAVCIIHYTAPIHPKSMSHKKVTPKYAHQFRMDPKHIHVCRFVLKKEGYMIVDLTARYLKYNFLLPPRK